MLSKIYNDAHKLTLSHARAISRETTRYNNVRTVNTV